MNSPRDHIPSYVAFLRWSSQFNKNEILEHERCQRVYELSDLQSMRFMVSATDTMAFLFVQRDESWMTGLPIQAACFSAKRLYLLLDALTLKEGVSINRAAIGLLFDDPVMHQAFSRVNLLSITDVVLGPDDRVVEIGKKFLTVALSRDDAGESLWAHSHQISGPATTKRFQL